MPRGPKGEKRPANPIARSVMIAKTSTGKIEENYYKQSQKVEAGKAGRKARAEKLSAEERSEIARKAGKSKFKRRKKHEKTSNNILDIRSLSHESKGNGT